MTAQASSASAVATRVNAARRRAARRATRRAWSQSSAGQFALPPSSRPSRGRASPSALRASTDGQATARMATASQQTAATEPWRSRRDAAAARRWRVARSRPPRRETSSQIPCAHRPRSLSAVVRKVHSPSASCLPQAAPEERVRRSNRTRSLSSRGLPGAQWTAGASLPGPLTSAVAPSPVDRRWWMLRKQQQ